MRVSPERLRRSNVRGADLVEHESTCGEHDRTTRLHELHGSRDLRDRDA
jgi:hypothetical protein